MLVCVCWCVCYSVLLLKLLYLQMTSFEIGYVVQSSFGFVPVVVWWTSGKAILHVKRFIVVHIVHQVEVTHFVFVRCSANENISIIFFICQRQFIVCETFSQYRKFQSGRLIQLWRCFPARALVYIIDLRNKHKITKIY